jgi:hypothetical protein
LLSLGHRRQKGQNGGERMLSPGRDFLIRTPINRNTPSFEEQMGTASSGVLEEFPLACLLKCWKGINPDNLLKKALIFFCTQDLSQYPLEIRKNGLRVGLLTTVLSSSYTCFARGRANGQKSPTYSCSFSLQNNTNDETV